MALAAVVYTWIGYPLVLRALAAARNGCGPQQQDIPRDGLPFLSVLIAAHNEEGCIGAKLENCLELDYPKDRIEFLVASDGSTDGTVPIAQEFSRRDERVRVFDRPGAGKTATQNVVVQEARGDIVLFTNADTLLAPDCALRMASAFSDVQVGCVGARLAWHDPSESVTGVGASAYWRFEYHLWTLESRLGLLSWAPGACMAVRRSHCGLMNPAFGEDVVLPLRVAGQGLRVVFEPAAVAFERTQTTSRSEFNIRRRMVLRSVVGTVAGLRELAWRRAWRVGVAVISHKLLRWITAYLLLIVLAASLVPSPPGLDQARLLLVGGQLSFYVIAAVGWAGDRMGRTPPRPFVWAHYFLLSVLAAAMGVAGALRGTRMTRFGSASHGGVA